MGTAAITTLYACQADAVALDGFLTAMAEGDQQAFAQFYAAARAPVFGFALAILRNRHDAEDVTQETFVRAFLAAGQYRTAGKPLAWLFTIAKHLAYEKCRADGHVTALPDGAWADEEAQTLPPEERMVLRAAMEALTAEERQIVMLHAVAGFRHREIGALLDLALPTVLSKYHRALKKLRENLKERE